MYNASYSDHSGKVYNGKKRENGREKEEDKGNIRDK